MMTENPDPLVGRQGTPFEFPIELGKVREFCRAIKTRAPEYQDGAVTPPTFLMASALWQSRENSPWGDDAPNLARLLHAEQEFVFHGPPPGVGAILTGQSRIDRRYTKTRKSGGVLVFTEIVTDYRAEDRLVAQVRQTLVETSKAAAQ
ncbi:hypothetical protein GPOL_c25310 [Gordonia polyisoprenivorans VH2]|uniref:FAS1-like dehydratase domain-containing protein n=2 Tax=Gordonia polyisoprenivorans TaxID=84595 RepID=H6N4H8_GORPV|nr:hypothetical protein GPOL_c25310 [Gordonia polyisoprenivorans VH2]